MPRIESGISRVTNFSLSESDENLPPEDILKEDGTRDNTEITEQKELASFKQKLSRWLLRFVKKI